MTWLPVNDFRAALRGQPRGELADFFPVLPSPFTLSVIRAAWQAATRALCQRFGVTVPPAWEEHDGQVWAVPAFWQVVGRAASVPAPALQTVLGLDGLQFEISRPRRGVLGFLRRRDGRNWDEDLREAVGVEGAVARWYRRVREMPWAQADILQVMEEIAPFAGRVLAAHAVVTLALADALSRHEDDVTPPASLPSHRPLQRLLEVTAAAGDEGALAEEVVGVAASFPWWGWQPFEPAVPRWHEDPTALVRHARERRAAASVTPREASGPRKSAWLAALDARETLRVALAEVMAAARCWALAAAEEALEDGRILQREDVFFLELEELKQMVTGEWSDPAHVQGVVEERKRRWQARAQELSALARPSPEEGAVVVGEEMERPPAAVAAVVAPGWHMGYAPVACGAKRLYTLVRARFSYGHLLGALCAGATFPLSSPS